MNEGQMMYKEAVMTGIRLEGLRKTLVKIGGNPSDIQTA
jgi:hypothetical protein